MTTTEAAMSSLAPALARLDLLLARGVAAAELLFGPAAAADQFRGLHISPAESQALLDREPGFPTLAIMDVAGENGRLLPASDAPAFAELGRRFPLDEFDLDVVLVALAPELDLRYERVYGFLQDDVTRKRPTVDLVLNLLCVSADEKLERRDRFTPGAPLVREHLLRVVADAGAVKPPLLAHALELDEQVVRLLTGGDSLDPRLAAFCELRSPAMDSIEQAAGLPATSSLSKIATRARISGTPLRVLLRGVPGSDRAAAAEALAAESGAPLLIADLHGLSGPGALGELAYVVAREAELLDAVLYVDGVDSLPTEHRPALERLLEASRSVAILAGSERWPEDGRADTAAPLGLITFDLPMPDFGTRKHLWKTELEERGSAVGDEELDGLAGRFTLTPRQIREAASVATTLRRGRSRRTSIDEVFAAARAQTGHELATLASRIDPTSSWNDIVLPTNTLAQLRELCSRATHRHRVMDEWGFGRKLTLGKGLSALFAGPAGSGKTMAAAIIAGELGLDLYRIDLSGVVSKWIGETEKNLERIFNAAENANVILFFDEADALFGRRSEVRDSHDRYANLEISYLLQRMEAYDGLAILATNLVENLDEAFVRRLAFRVDFPFPEEAERRRIWEVVWPPEVPLARRLDFDLLAREVPFAGGNIKNVALAASFLAAEDGTRVTMAHLLHAVRREYEKLGKSVAEDELVPSAGGR